MKKIWGTAFSLIGDLIISLPQLNYFKNKYKDIYVNFIIHKKIAYCAPLFFNHPLIDKIHISGEWSSFDEKDYELASRCDFVTTKIDHINKKIFDRKHDRLDWYNTRDVIDESALMSGIEDFPDKIIENEKYPTLYKWFDEGFEDIQKKAAYACKKKEKNNENFILSNSISIFPFAGYGRSKNRNPDKKWWDNLVNKFVENKIHVYHFGYITEPSLSSDKKFYHKLTNLDFFYQIRIALGSKMSIGVDSGSMWAMAAYSHPTIVLLTNWFKGHKENFYATNPINLNGDSIFTEGGFSKLSEEDVFEKCLKKGVKKIDHTDKFFSFFR